jgi:hypothetical protein
MTLSGVSDNRERNWLSAARLRSAPTTPALPGSELETVMPSCCDEEKIYGSVTATVLLSLALPYHGRCVGK